MALADATSALPATVYHCPGADSCFDCPPIRARTTETAIPMEPAPIYPYQLVLPTKIVA